MPLKKRKTHKRITTAATLFSVFIFITIILVPDYATLTTSSSYNTDELIVPGGPIEKRELKLRSLGGGKYDNNFPHGLSSDEQNGETSSTLENYLASDTSKILGAEAAFQSADVSRPTPTITYPEQTLPTPKADYELDFSKIANGTPVNTFFRVQDGIDDNWHPSWLDEKQMYRNRPENVRIENGMLVIQARIEASGEISSAKVDTQGKFQATYGRFEVVAKMPTGIGTFPAIWMLASSNGSYFRNFIATPSEKSDPISWQGDGEIDIMEFLGILPTMAYHDAHTFASLHKSGKPNYGEASVPTISTDFHTYAVDWRSDAINYYVDNVKTHTVTKTSDDFRVWPYSRPFYLILNLAMGGEWNDDELARQGKSFPKGIDNASQNGWYLYIKSIRHFPLS